MIREEGAILLPVAIVVFIISLSLAGWVTFRLWQNNFQLPFIQKVALATPTPTITNDFLSAKLILDNTLESKRQELTKKLLLPMRQYYATRPEHLGNITVEKIDDNKHSARVTFDLIKDSGSKTVSFYYDGDKWDPGMLDNTN